MWIIQFFSLVSLVIVTSYAHPTSNLRDVNSNAIVSVVADEAVTEDHGAELKHPMVVQSKPRIVVSYGNVYKQTPVDPIQNLLTYFLMNVARDFAQDQDQFERRRSPGFYTDAKTTVTNAGSRIKNESENIGYQIGDAFKNIAEREVPAQTRYEEAHFYPHIDGTCMCFNRLIRHGPVEMKNDLHVKDDRVNQHFNEIPPVESTSKDVTIGQMKADKTIDFKAENNIIVSNKEKEKSAVALAEVAPEMQPITKQNNTPVRVLKVLDLASLEANSPSVDTTESKTQLEQKVGGDLVVEQKAPSLTHVELRRDPSTETGKPPFVGEGQIIKKAELSENKNRTIEDDGIYFLLVSGGTDKRTTAANLKSLEGGHYENLLPKYEDKLPHLKEMKRRKRRRKRHHNHLAYRRLKDRKHKIEVMNEKIRRRNKRHEENKSDISLGDKLMKSYSNLTQGDLSFILPNFFNDDQNIQPRAQEEQATQQTMFLTVTLPTFVGVGLALLALCYFLRTTGWCCKLFLDKSNIVVMDVNQATTTPETVE